MEREVGIDTLGDGAIALWSLGFVADDNFFRDGNFAWRDGFSGHDDFACHDEFAWHDSFCIGRLRVSWLCVVVWLH
jgi:hypothetical protein